MARNYGTIKETFTVDDRILKRKHIRPADTFRKGDSLELLNDGMTLKAARLVKKTSKDTVRGGVGQRVFSKSISVYTTDYDRFYIEVVYDSFSEEETIIVLSKREYESGEWKKELEEGKLAKIKNKRYKSFLFENISNNDLTLQDFYLLNTVDAKQAFVEAIKEAFNDLNTSTVLDSIKKITGFKPGYDSKVEIDIDSFYKSTTTESLYELGESDDIDEEGSYVDFDVEYDIGRRKEELRIEGFYNDYPRITHILNGKKKEWILSKTADEINFTDLIINVIKKELLLGESTNEKNNFEEAYKKFVETFNWYTEDQGITLDTDIEVNTFGSHFYIKGNVEIKGRKINNINEKEVELFYNLKNDLTSLYPIKFMDQIYLTQRYEIVNGKEKPFFVLKLGSRKPFFDFKNILEELVNPENWNDAASNLALKMVECILNTVGLLK